MGAQVQVQNLFFGGDPIAPPPSTPPPILLLERYQRRHLKLTRVGSRNKNFYRPEFVAAPLKRNPHGARLERGYRVVHAPSHLIRMNHYWGERENGFRGDSPTRTKTLTNDSSVQVGSGQPLWHPR